MENWKAIEGFEKYEVSDQGRVRRVQPAKGTKAGKVLRQGTTPDGRLLVSLRKDGASHSKMVSVIVARAFIPNPLHLPEVNHTGKKTDNRAAKLEWRTKAGNEQHAVLNEQHGKGVRLDKRRGTWHAYYSPKPYTFKHIGSFRTEQEALAARRAMVAKLPRIE